jgi:hypothetical protein
MYFSFLVLKQQINQLVLQQMLKSGVMVPMQKIAL